MQLGRAPLSLSAPSASVIEGILDVTTVYYITVETRVRNYSPLSSPPPSCSCRRHTSAALPVKERSRPVATVRPFSIIKECEQECQELPLNSEFEESNKKRSTDFENLGKKHETLLLNGINDVNKTCESINEDISETYILDLQCDKDQEKEEEEEQILEHSEAPCEAPSSPSSEPASPSPTQQPPPPLPLRNTNTSSKNSCWCHCRISKALSSNPNNFTLSTSPIMEMCQNGVECHEGQECHNGQGCDAGDIIADLKSNNDTKEAYITECLDEFLEELQLPHLRDYFMVLGCTCIRDLKFLEEPELNAIQLISRRRLMKRLNSMSLHHQEPPSNCTLEGWLSWYGLTHISGFLNAIGVLSVADVSYLREDDLMLLKPVVRRKILSLYRK